MQPYNPEWQDMSDYVVHFTKSTATGDAYNNMLSILGSRVLNASLFGIGRHCAPDKDTQASVCFSEAPLHLIERVAQEKGRYGIGFSKRFILERIGGPIWYVERGGSAHKAIWALIRQALHAPQPVDDPIWELTPFIDSHGGTYQYEWEREWRHRGNLQFTEDDVAFLYIPEELHGTARNFFQNALDENIGPAYFCPYLDVGWNQERIRQSLEQQE